MALRLVKRTKESANPSREGKSRHEYLVDCLKDEVDDPKFSDWERGFIVSLARQVGRGRDLSEKQRQILERIWAK